MKSILLGIAIALLVVIAGGYLWARTALTGDAVRTALAAQLSRAIGQPVSIGGVTATAFPRVTIDLVNVVIGKPERIRLADLRLGAAFRALLSRRIEHGSLELNGARIELPLPPFALTPSSTSAPAQSAPVQLVSIDEIVLRHVDIVSGGRTLTGDVELAPQGSGFVLRHAALTAERTRFTASGTIADPAAPSADIAVKASALDVDQLLAFAAAFSAASGSSSASPSSRHSAAGPMNVVVSLQADRATMRGVSIDHFAGRAHLTPRAIALEPIGFNVFGGHYDGAMTFTPTSDALPFRARASVAGVDVAAALRSTGSGDVMSGRLSGRFDLSGSAAAARIVSTLRGTARVDITDGVVKHLGLVRAVVIATSMRAGASSTARGGSDDEPFSRLGATLRIGAGSMTTDDLRFESKNLTTDGGGVLNLNASTVDLHAKVQLSDELSQQAGRDLVRYTQEGGRVTLPARVTGPFAAPHVDIDVGDMLQRGLRNAAESEIKKALPRLFKR